MEEVPDSSDQAAILVVDDHPPNLIAAEAVLESLGFPIFTAGSGADALHKVVEKHFAMIVMDVQMPFMDGFETTRRLREREQQRDVPVIFLTAGNPSPEEVQRGYALGAVDFITKPYDTNVFRAKVRALIGLYSRAQRIERQRSRELDRIKDLFLGAVGHDLRNPLHSISMAQKLTLAVECSQPSHRSHALRTDRAAQRMNGMIEDILDLTRGQFAEGIPLNVRAADLEEVTRAALDEFRVAHPERELEFAAVGDVTGIWDTGRLARVVSNLVGNAIQHCTGATVRVGLSGEEERVVLRVHNSGEPIPERSLPKLFEPFRRGETSAEGLGLGLYIVSEIVRAHAGTVGVTSTPTEGTTFTVSLPRRPPQPTV